MKIRTEVTAEKLRGGFYTPRPLVEACLERVRERLHHRVGLSLLEPSVGDGAFIRGLAACGWQHRIEHVQGVETLELEAEKSRHSLREASVPGHIALASAIAWSAETSDQFDVAVGNPPFVRYQFVDERDRKAILGLGARLGIEFSGVANLWIPVLIGALSRLRPGGAFAFVIPTECLTGCSAGVVRQWLVDECEEICFDLFAPGSFPGVLQEVLILSGRRAAGQTQGALSVRIVEHLRTGRAEWSYAVQDADVWTRYLLDPAHLDALEEARRLPLARRLGDLVAFEVSIVTGANDFFSVDDTTLRDHALEPWARPLLPRTRHAPGLVFTEGDREAAHAAGAKVWLLDFGADKPNPLRRKGARAYVAQGEAMELHKRYKCRIRAPWYRVPGIVRGALLLSKRSHMWPRVIVNEAESFTTDTIYRGRMVTTDRTPRDIAAAFHNSLTLLTAELEGRTFGGGVLELVPSEIARLTTLVPDSIGAVLPEFDGIARTTTGDELVEATDDRLVKMKALDKDLVPLLREARELLAARRFDRNRRVHSAEEARLAAPVTAAA